jgi:hypothetical protein
MYCLADFLLVTFITGADMSYWITFFNSPAQLLMHFSITKGDIVVSGTPPSLRTSRGIIRYRDKDFDNLSDDEICK